VDGLIEMHGDLKVWSGRPGSNQRRPAWEFSIEFDVFRFHVGSLDAAFRHQNFLSVSSNFNKLVAAKLR
jgi:hypothetical protein